MTHPGPPAYGPPAGTPAPAPGIRMPGIAAAAAVLGFVEAAFGLCFVLYALTQISVFGTGGDGELFALLLFGTIAIGALLLLGGLFLVRGTGRRLLLGTTVAEIVIGLGLAIWAAAETSSSPDYGYYGGVSNGEGWFIGAGLGIGLLLPVVRLCLAVQRPVGEWVGRATAARRDLPPVWSPGAGSWTPDPGATPSPGPLVALMAPVLVLAVLAVIGLATAPDDLDYAFSDVPSTSGLPAGSD